MSRRHLPFQLALTGGVVAFVILLWLNLIAAALGATITFFAIYLVFTAARVPRLTAGYLKANAARADEPAWFVFAITVGTVIVSLSCLFVVANEKNPPAIDLALSLGTAALGWFTIHTMAALHYAHLYWRPDDRTPEEDERHEGLDFPGKGEPGVWDFLYFAFVTGMTAQTSDVAITTTAMRKFNLVHGIASFFFNTVLVAAAVNVALSITD